MDFFLPTISLNELRFKMHYDWTTQLPNRQDLLLLCQVWKYVNSRVRVFSRPPSETCRCWNCFAQCEMCYYFDMLSVPSKLMGRLSATIRINIYIAMYWKYSTNDDSNIFLYFGRKKCMKTEKIGTFVWTQWNFLMIWKMYTCTKK